MQSTVKHDLKTMLQKTQVFLGLESERTILERLLKNVEQLKPVARQAYDDLYLSGCPSVRVFFAKINTSIDLVKVDVTKLLNRNNNKYYGLYTHIFSDYVHNISKTARGLNFAFNMYREQAKSKSFKDELGLCDGILGNARMIERQVGTLSEEMALNIQRHLKPYYIKEQPQRSRVSRSVSSKKTRTTERATFKGADHDVYVGSRGGRYVKVGGKFESLAR